MSAPLLRNDPLTRLLARLVSIRPAPRRCRTAAIAGICMALPVGLAYAVHRPALGAIGGLGSLAALYGRPSPPGRDAGAVAVAVLGLVTGFLVGSSAQGRPWLAVVVTGVWAMVVTVVCGAVAARPPGIVMPILVGALATALPPQNPLPLAAAVAATGALATLLIWASAWLSTPAAKDPRSRRRPTGVLLYPVWRPYARTLAWAGLRTGGGVSLGGVLALVVGAPHPFWGMATAAAVLATGNHAVTVNDRALLRGTGTLLGCLVAGGVLALHPDKITTVLLLAFFTFMTECVVARNYALAMVFVTPMAIVLASVASPVAVAPWILAAERLLQTVLGCVAAVIAGRLVTVHWASQQRLRAIRAVLLAAADLLERPQRDGLGDKNADVLTRRISHLELVSARTAGERPAVRSAMTALDALAQDTATAAKEALRRYQDAAEGDPDGADALRDLAARLDTASKGTARTTAPVPQYPSPSRYGAVDG
ncbi:FUSC family protein [Streptomyces nigra]|uniref:FUSC family protein n=1 Tax=Streptomyces nigra TaxID=1827580 RepID=UPI0036C397C2